MPTIDELVAGLQLPDEERKKLLWGHMLTGLGASMMGARRGQEWQAAGRGLLGGMTMGQNAVVDARQGRLDNLRARGAAYDILGKEQSYQDQELLRQQQEEFRRRFSGGGASPGAGLPLHLQQPQETPGVRPPVEQRHGGPSGQYAGIPGPQPTGMESVSMPAGSPNAPAQPQATLSGGTRSKREQAEQMKAYGDYWTAQGRPDKAAVYYQYAEKATPILKDSKILQKDGRRVVVNMYNDGSHEILPYEPDKEKLHFSNAGGVVGVGQNQFTGVVEYQGIPTTMTPDQIANRDLEERKFRYQQGRDKTKDAEGTKPPPGYRWTQGGQGLEAIPGGPHDTSAKDAQRAANALSRANIVVDTVDEALKRVNNRTTGPFGAISGLMPGTPAYDLRGTVDTIKANLSFEALQAMREASPTGGALGSITERELHLLGSTIASLDANQRPELVRKNLLKVQTHFNNWKKAVEQARGPKTLGAPNLNDLEAEMQRRGMQP